MKIVPDPIRQWVPTATSCSAPTAMAAASRAQLRRHCEVDQGRIVVASASLTRADEGKLDRAIVKSPMQRVDIDPEEANPVTQ